MRLHVFRAMALGRYALQLNATAHEGVHMPKLKPLSSIHRLGWYSASLVFGLCLVAFAVEVGALANPDSFHFAALILMTCWLIVVVLLRLFVQQIEDPTSLKSVFGTGRKPRK